MVNGFVAAAYSLPLSTTCSIVKELSGELAEALILKEQYGPEVADTDKDGFRKFESAVETLKLIQDGTMKLLADSNSQELTRDSTTQIKGFPDNTSDTLTTTASTAPQVRMGDIF